VSVDHQIFCSQNKKPLPKTKNCFPAVAIEIKGFSADSYENAKKKAWRPSINADHMPPTTAITPEPIII
jgi:hypothetical protein